MKINEIIDTYPNIFYNNEGRSTMVWPHIECNEGWFGVIAGLCSVLSQEYPGVQVHQIKEKFGGLRFYYGYSQLSYSWFEALLSRISRWMFIHNHGIFWNKVLKFQRWCLPQAADKIEVLVNVAEAQASRTCEMCGAPGAKASNGGWLKTLCHDHFEEYSYETWLRGCPRADEQATRVRRVAF